ncbi:MAG: hypothetical protein KI793_36030 [Rivularia sp. (in: Bacteria)]|nr:hypothetical protein [Rivularia sp. MS3]
MNATVLTKKQQTFTRRLSDKHYYKWREPNPASEKVNCCQETSPVFLSSPKNGSLTSYTNRYEVVGQ